MRLKSAGETEKNSAMADSPRNGHNAAMKTDKEKLETALQRMKDLENWMRRRAERNTAGKADDPETAYKQCAYRLQMLREGVEQGL